MPCHCFATSCKRPAWHGAATKITTATQRSTPRCAIADPAVYDSSQCRVYFVMADPADVPGLQHRRTRSKNC